MQFESEDPKASNFISSNTEIISFPLVTPRNFFGLYFHSSYNNIPDYIHSVIMSILKCRIYNLHFLQLECLNFVHFLAFILLIHRYFSRIHIFYDTAMAYIRAELMHCVDGQGGYHWFWFLLGDIRYSSAWCFASPSSSTRPASLVRCYVQ